MQIRRGVLKENLDGTVEMVVIVSKEDAATFLNMPIGTIYTITEGYATDSGEKPPTQIFGDVTIPNKTRFGSEDAPQIPPEYFGLEGNPHFQAFVAHMTGVASPEDSLIAAIEFICGEIKRGASEAMIREFTSWRTQKFGV